MQFSLRTLLILFAVVGAFFAGRIPALHRANLAEEQLQSLRLITMDLVKHQLSRRLEQLEAMSVSSEDDDERSNSGADQ